MAITGQELKDLIGNPVAVFTLNEGEGAGMQSHYGNVTSYDPQQGPAVPESNGPSEPSPM